jgi:hypothetical protein
MKTLKKISLIALLLAASGFTAAAQDKIITTSGDTVVCRIVSISDSHIIYEQQSDDKSISGKTISLAEVSEYARTSDNPPSITAKKAILPERPWLFSLSGGGSWMPWLLKNAEEDVPEDSNFNQGFSLSASAHYLLRDYIGFGVQYSFFTSGYESDAPMMIESYLPTYTNSYIKERQYVNYVGASVIFRQFLDRNHKLTLNETLGGGLLMYRAESQSTVFIPMDYYGYGGNMSQNALITRNSFGATAGISVEYKVLPFLAVGVGGNFMYGRLSKINGKAKDSTGYAEELSDFELENPINLSRIDYSLMLRFQF